MTEGDTNLSLLQTCAEALGVRLSLRQFLHSLAITMGVELLESIVNVHVRCFGELFVIAMCVC